MKIITFLIAFLMLSVAASFSSNTSINAVQTSYVSTQVNMENMTLYLKNDTITHTVNGIHTTYIFNTTMGNRGTVDSGTQSIIEDWYLTPALAGNYSLNNTTAYFWIFIRFYGTDNNPNLYVTLYDVNSTGSQVQIGAGSTHPILASTIESYTVPVALNYVVPANHTIHIHFVLSGGASTQYWVYYGNSTYASGISFNTFSHLTIKNIETLNYNGTPVIGFLEKWSNKTMYINAILKDPLGGYDIKNVSLRILKPDKSQLLDQPMVKISGTPTSLLSIYQFTMNYSSLPEGNYTIIVYALDNNGYYYYLQNFKYDGYLQVGYSYFWIGLPVSIYIHLYDTLGEPLKFSLVSLELNNASYSNTTNNSGFTKIDLFTGTYTVHISWNGTNLPEIVKVYYNRTYYTIGNTVNVKGNETVNITADVGILAFRVLNSIGGMVPNALLYVTYPNNYEKIYNTGESGNVNIGVSAGGIYRIKVYYMDQLVANSTYSVDFISSGSSITQNVITEVYQLTLQAVDAKNFPVQGEQIYVSNAYGQLLNTTNFNGNATFILPKGEYDLKSYYMGVLVNSSKIVVDGNINLEVNSSIFYISLMVQDSKGIPVSDAYIQLTGENGLTFFSTTSSSPSLFKLPLGTYNLKVTWEGVNVNTSTVLANMNENITVNSSIYYLHVDVVGNDNRTIGHGWIVVEMNGTLMAYSNSTNTTFRLPAGNYQIRANIDEIYLLTPVNMGTELNYTLTNNTSIKVEIRGYPVPFYTTYLFYLIIIVIIFALIIAYIALKLSGGKRKGGLKPWEGPPKS